jgi:hypothetical protein
MNDAQSRNRGGRRRPIRTNRLWIGEIPTTNRPKYKPRRQPVVPSPGNPYAAGADAASPWNFTLTSLDTPGSCIVTPYSACAASMVRLE